MTYKLIETHREIKDKAEIENGFTLFEEWDHVHEFQNKADALAALAGKDSTLVRMSGTAGTYYIFTEYAVIEVDNDDNVNVCAMSLLYGKYRDAAKAVLEKFDLPTSEAELTRCFITSDLTINVGTDGKEYVWYYDGTKEAACGMDGKLLTDKQISVLLYMEAE